MIGAKGHLRVRCNLQKSLHLMPLFSTLASIRAFHLFVCSHEVLIPNLVFAARVHPTVWVQRYRCREAPTHRCGHTRRVETSMRLLSLRWSLGYNHTSAVAAGPAPAGLREFARPLELCDGADPARPLPGSVSPGLIL